MKKLSIFLLALVASTGTMFAEKIQIGDLYYNLDATNKTAEVTSQNSGYPYWSATIATANIPSSMEYNSVTYTVTSIGEHAFYGCTGLTSVTIPGSVTSIGEDAFHGCTGLTSMTIPNSVTSIEWGAFEFCSGLTSVTIPNSVTSIGDEAFYGCTALTSLSVEAGNTVYDSRNNCNAIVETSTNTLILGCQNTTIPNSVTSIGDYAFYNCTGLTSVTIPNSVTSIGDYAFEGCIGLTSVTIPDSVTSTEKGAFYNCTGLTSVTIGNRVTSIGDHAFDGCSSLSSVICKAVNPPTLGDYVFVDDNSLAHIYVPAESVSTYKAATNWSDHEAIIEAILPVEIDFRTNPYTVSSGEAISISGSWHDNLHGYSSPKVTIPLVAGNYKITIGNCDVSKDAACVKNSDESATLNLIDANGQTITSFTAKGNCYHNGTSTNITSVWFVAATDQTIKVICPQYTPYLKVESVESVPEAVTVYTVTFANAEGATGIVPAAKANLAPNTEITLPKNFTMYKSGATFTEWTDGSNSYAPNTSYTVTDNVTLTAVYSDNTVALDDRTAATTIKWLFSQSDGVPAINVSGSTTFVVAQAEVADKTIDVKLPIDARVKDGKFVNSSNTWTQINPGVIFTIPSAKEAVITYKQYDNGAITTPVINVDASDATYALTAAGTSGQLYYEYIQVALPAPDPTGMEEANANAKAIKVLRDGQLLIIKNGKTYNAQGIVVK